MYKDKSKHNLHKSAGGATDWDTAIADAQEMITDYKERIDRLNRAKKTFAAMRDQGESFPHGRARKAGNKAAEATV